MIERSSFLILRPWCIEGWSSAAGIYAIVLFLATYPFFLEVNENDQKSLHFSRKSICHPKLGCLFGNSGWFLLPSEDEKHNLSWRKSVRQCTQSLEVHQKRLILQHLRAKRVISNQNSVDNFCAKNGHKIRLPFLVQIQMRHS